MNLTDLMVCGFDGDRLVFCANVASDDYTVILTPADDLTGDPRLAEQAPRFAALLELAQGLNTGTSTTVGVS